MYGGRAREGGKGRASKVLLYCFDGALGPLLAVRVASSASMCSEVLFGVSRRGGIGRDGGTEGEGTAGRYWGLLCLRRNSRQQVGEGAKGNH